MKKTTQQIFGARLALLRTAHGMSQEQVARVLNVSRSTYSYYESGKSAPSLDSLRKLIELFCPDNAHYLLLIRPSDPDDEPNGLLHDEAGEERPPMTGLTRPERQVVAFYRVLSDARREELLDLLGQWAAEQPQKEAHT